MSALSEYLSSEEYKESLSDLFDLLTASVYEFLSKETEVPIDIVKKVIGAYESLRFALDSET